MCLLLIGLGWLTYRWVNACGMPLAFGDILPFARSGHTTTYNYAACLLVLGAVMGIRQLWRKTDEPE